MFHFVQQDGFLDATLATLIGEMITTFLGS